MKNLNRKMLIAALSLGMLFTYSACKKTSLDSFDRDFAGIYFQSDSLYYSFGVTSLDVDVHHWQVPMRIIGGPSSTNRVVEVEIDQEKTNAIEGVHFRMPNAVNVVADSVNAYITIEIVRGTLGEDDYKITLNLKENENFTPSNKPLTTISLHFNNRVEPPSWKDWAGRPTWPTSQLGPWHPVKYIKFIELFRALEEKAPASYQNMVSEFGPDLENVTFGWPWDYDNTMKKYVLVPLYQYFMEQHPEMGITVPRPSIY